MEYIVKKPKFVRKFRRLPGFEYIFLWRKKLYVDRLRIPVANGVSMLECLGSPLMRIEIDTLSWCQNDCEFCPVNIHKNIRPHVRMADQLYLKIINELHDMDYDQGLYLSSNDEPLLDFNWGGFDLIQKLQMARDQVPKSYLVIYTNGLLFTPEKYHAIMKHLDFIVIDNYNDTMKLLLPIRAALSDATESELARTMVLMKYKHDVMDTRGGNSPTRKILKPADCSCTNPFSEMVILADGKVPLCCQDVYGQHIMGDLNRQTITEVFHGPQFDAIRKGILEKGRQSHPMCQVCDFIRYCPACREDLWSQGVIKVKSLKEMEGTL